VTDRALSEAESWPNVCIVGPLPPPSGGMANQCEQLARLLCAAGVVTEVVQTNVPYRPPWVRHLPYFRETFRLIPYLIDLWRKIGRAEVVHVFANSGWAWHLVAMPALLVARLRGVAAIVNYRGGQADEFLSKAPRHVRASLAKVQMRVTPSVYLRRVFSKYGLDAEVIPNIIDLSRFGPGPIHRPGARPHLIVTRNLEPIYDIPTALRAFARIRQNYPSAQLTVAGSGAELAALERLASELGVAEAVYFSGRHR
jgi:glycosyltransferase involved in cell wall biosynthesis